MHAKPTSKTCIASFCLLGALVFTAAGCVIEVDDPIVEPLYFNDMADMEVRWSINGSTDPIWCNDLGIETWLVELSGRDAQDVYVDCRGDFLGHGFRALRVDGGRLPGPTDSARLRRYFDRHRWGPCRRRLR
jgi:hypothetical protein